ncbi:MAG: phosphotransferase family protein [Acidimicrobiales bacterium]
MRSFPGAGSRGLGGSGWAAGTSTTSSMSSTPTGAHTGWCFDAGPDRAGMQTMPIHDVNGTAKAKLDAYRLYFDRAEATPTRWMPATPVWKQATAAVREPPPPTTMTLIHRDYHPENTLWSRRRLTGVVDWTQASWGPPALDLGHMRWNLVVDHGQAVADQFLACYRAATGAVFDDQSYWDLVSLLDLLLGGSDDPGDIQPDDLQRLEDYVMTALSHWS